MIISLDTETTGKDLRHGARPFLVTICSEEAPEPVFWEWDVNPRTRKVLADIDDFLEILSFLHQADAIVLQNPKFDYTALRLLARDLGLETDFNLAWNWTKIRDTLIGGHLLASSQPHDLTTMALVYLGVNIQPFEDAVVTASKEARRLAKAGFNLWRIAKDGLPDMPSAGGNEKIAKYDMWLPRAYLNTTNCSDPDHPWWTVCSDYANMDSLVTLNLYKKMLVLISDKELLDIYLERLKIIPVLAQMEEVGVFYSGERLEELQARYSDESEEAAQNCLEIAESRGVELVLPKSGNNNSLRKFIFETLELPVIERSQKTGEQSLDKSVMVEYQATLPEGSQELSFIENLLGKRKRDTALSYMEGYERYRIPVKIGDEEWYRLHPSVNPTGSATLRMSSSNPNEQNISKSEGFNLRYAFGPAPGREWYSIDYENLELKIPAYESGEQIMIDVFEKPDEPPFFGSYHLLNASIVYPDEFWSIAENKGEFKKRYAATYYQWIKNFGFAVQYGAQEPTADRTARKNGAYAAVKAKMQNIEALNQSCIKHANKYGYVETIPDKEISPTRGYPLMCRRSHWGSISPTLPLNYRVQGTACWIMMRAMIKVQQYLDSLNRLGHACNHIHIVMNIHDELVLDFPQRSAKFNLPKVRKIRNIMASIGDCVGVPLTCGVTHHPHNWSEGVSV